MLNEHPHFPTYTEALEKACLLDRLMRCDVDEHPNEHVSTALEAINIQFTGYVVFISVLFGVSR